VAGSIVIRHTSAFDLSRSTLASLGLVCADARAPANGRELNPDDWKRLKLALEIIATGLNSQPIMRLAMIALGASVDLVLHRLSRPHSPPALSPATGHTRHRYRAGLRGTSDRCAENVLARRKAGKSHAVQSGDRWRRSGKQ